MQNINEELNRMLYLTQHKRGLVISEQSDGEVRGGSRNYAPIGVPDWGDKSKGLLSFNTGDKVHAKNVNFNGESYSITSFSTINKKSPQQLPPPPPPVTPPPMPSIEFTDDSFPYDDNMVTPNFKRNPIASQKFDDYVNSIVTTLSENKNNLNSIGEIQIQGSADSSKPNLRVPSGYSKLDHDVVSEIPYNGSTDPFTMNQFLADNRAKIISNILIERIKSESGVDITSKVKTLKGINYYNPKSTSKSGVKSMVIKMIPGTPSPIENISPDNKNNGSTSTITPSTGELDLSQWGGSKVPYTEVIDKKTNQVSYGIKRKDLESLVSSKIIVLIESTKFNEKTEVDGRIKNGKLIVDGIDFGELVDPSSVVRTEDSSVSFVTNPGRYGYFGSRDGFDLIRLLRFGLTKL